MKIRSCLNLLQKMPIFTQRLNPITGQNEWILQQEDYDYIQEVSRSSYADMLHDEERNEKYYEGIRRSVKFLRNQNKEVHVLDIGTGTGLLSMMALSCGADSVTACEAFLPMANCAKDVLKLNGFCDKITLIPKRSTEIECGEGKEMPYKANLLVAEVFDTELIGEGAIETFAHAKQYLLSEDALVVPAKATLYAQVISSDLVRRWNRIEPLYDQQEPSMSLLEIPQNVSACPGAAAVHDLQLSQISKSEFKEISTPIPVFHFDWAGREISLEKKRSTSKDFRCLNSGLSDAVFMWWDIIMDPYDEVTLSCAPVWAHPLTKGRSDATSSQIPWRDHWMQAVYYFPTSSEVKEGDQGSLIAHHDEYSLWFSLGQDTISSESKIERPICSCGLHATTSRTRIGQMNDPLRREFYLKLLKAHVTEDTTALFLGDVCYLAIAAAKLGAKHVYVHHSDSLNNVVMKTFLKENDISDKVTLTSSLSDIDQSKVKPISLVFSEPFFDTSLLPWHSLQFMYRLKLWVPLFSKEAVILPQSFSILAVPVQFRDLWKIRAPLGSCCGFDLNPFDELIDKACDETDEIVEPQPLWEYPCIALSRPSVLFSLNVSEETKSSTSFTTTLPIEQAGTLNGMAVWADWHFGAESLSTGPIKDVVPGQEIQWDKYSRQGVFLFKTHHSLSSVDQGIAAVVTDVGFNSLNGVFDFNFEFKNPP